MQKYETYSNQNQLIKSLKNQKILSFKSLINNLFSKKLIL